MSEVSALEEALAQPRRNLYILTYKENWFEQLDQILYSLRVAHDLIVQAARDDNEYPKSLYAPHTDFRIRVAHKAEYEEEHCEDVARATLVLAQALQKGYAVWSVSEELYRTRDMVRKFN